MAASILGCGDHAAYLTHVGGGQRIANLELNGLTYTRQLNEISSYRLDLSAEQEDRCRHRLETLEPWDYEVSIFRDEEEVHCGPVIDPVYLYDGMTIHGRDLFQWFERRWHPVDRALTDDLSNIAATYMRDGLAADPSPNISFIINPTEVIGQRSITALNYPRVADSVRELSRQGMDFTTVARNVILGKERSDPPILNLTEDIFELPDGARLNGLEQANDIAVLGAQPTGVATPLVGRAGGVDTPLVQQVYSDPNILDTDSATAGAESRWLLLNRAPRYVTGRLLESAPIAFNDLIPGVRMRLRQQVGFRYFDIILRLVAVDVTVAGSETGLNETVTLTLAPPSVPEGE